MDKESDSLLTLQLLFDSWTPDSLRLVTRGDYHFSPVSAGGVGYNETRVFLLLLSYPLNSPPLSPLSHPGQKGRKGDTPRNIKIKRNHHKRRGGIWKLFVYGPVLAGWLGSRDVQARAQADLLPTNGGPGVSSCCCIGQSQVHMVRMSLFTLPLLNLLSAFLLFLSHFL
jgi:hypothetical protein